MKKSHSNLIKLKPIKDFMIPFFLKKVKNKIKKSHSNNFFNLPCSQYKLYQVRTLYSTELQIMSTIV